MENLVIETWMARCKAGLLFILCLFGESAFAQYPWNDQTITPNSYAPTAAITAASGGSDMLFNGGNQLFYVGTDQKVHNYWRDANSDWQENVLCPTAQQAIPNSGLAVDLQSRIYYVGTDGYIYQLSWTLPSGPWTATQLSTFSSGSFLAARNNSRLGIYNISSTACRIFYVATDGYLHFVECNGSSWKTGILSSNPQAVSASSNFAVENTGRIFYVNSNNQVSNGYPNGPMYAEFPLSLTGSPARPFTGISLDASGVYYIASTTQRIHRYTWASGPGWTDVVVNASSVNVKPGGSFTLNGGQLMYTASSNYNYVIYNSGASVSLLTTPVATTLQKSSWGTKDGLAYYFDAAGKLHQLTPNLTISNITTSGVLHEKFEIGVDLATNLETDINNFCNNAHLSTPFPAGAKNPYDPDQIRVKATYTDPSNKKYTRYGFFYRDVNIVDANNYNISSTLNTYPFRIRIAPEATGTWTVNVELYVNNVLANSTAGTFSVASSSRKGPLTLVSGKYFKDFNGNDFFIVGQNADVPPPDLITTHTEYWPSSAIPVSFTNQRSTIADLASKNANFIRWRVTPWAYELEGAHSYTQNLPFRTLEKNLNNYDTRQHYAWEMDQTVTTLEQNNMYSMLTLFYDPFWSHTDADWWGNPSIRDQSNFEYNPYSTYELPLTSASSPQRSFTDCSSNHALAYTSMTNFYTENNATYPRFRNIKKKMFYMMARWGYSPNIAIWQITNEADNTGNIASYPWTISNVNSKYNTDPVFKAALEAWTSNVNSYLKTFYPVKTSMNGYGGVGTGWGLWPSPSNQSSTQEICSFNSYPDGVGDYYPEFLTHAVYRKSPVNRPFLQSEHGFMAGSVDGCSEYESHKRVWSGTFTGALGTPLLFWDQYEDKGVDHRTKFTYIADFMSSYNTVFPNYLNAVNWTPEATNIAGAAHYEPGYGNGSVKRETNFYLRSSNQNTVLGWLNNYGYNWWSLRLANQLNDDPQVAGSCASDLATFTPPATYTATYDFDENGLYKINPTTNFSGTSIEPYAEVSGLKASANYYLEPYDTYQGGYLPALNQTITTDATGKAKFSIELNNSIDKVNKKYPDYAYRLTWIDPTHPQRRGVMEKAPHLEKASSAAVSPNPTTGLVTITGLSGLIASIEGYDPMGKLLFHVQNVNDKSKVLDLSPWEGQTIILKVKDDAGNVTVHRCVVITN